MTRSPRGAPARILLLSLAIPALLALTGCDGILEQLPGDDPPGRRRDPLPVLSVAAVQPVEEGGGITFRVTLSRASDLVVTARYHTEEGTARAGPALDFEHVSGTVTLEPGDREEDIVVPTLPDGVEEGSERFTLRLAEATNARLATAAATGTILGDDDTQARAVPVAPGVHRTGQLETADDVDYFKVVVPASGAVIAATDPGQADNSGNGVQHTVVRIEHDGRNGRVTPLQIEAGHVHGALVAVSGTAPVDIFIRVSSDVATPYDLAIWVIDRQEVPWFFGDAVEESFDIELRYVGIQPTAARKAIIRDAADVWERVITEGVPDRFIASSATVCDPGDPSMFGAHVDDLLVYVNVAEMDGLGRTLAQAGPCWARLPGHLPYLGIVILDVDDLPSLHRAGVLGRIVIHEIGHALGFGTTWHQIAGPDGRPLLREPSIDLDDVPRVVPGRDTYFNGRAARAAFDSAGGSAYRGGGVPVENDTSVYGAGTLDAHWRESVFGAELMTSSQLTERGSREPLSAVTVAALQDMGYAVDNAAAEPYTLPPAPRAAAGSLARSETAVVHLVDDVRAAPVMIEDPRSVPRVPPASE